MVMFILYYLYSNITFNVLEGLDSPFLFPDSRSIKVSSLFDYGFQPCPYIIATQPLTLDLVNQYIENLTVLAGKKHLPIDGIVMIFDSLDYSKSCGRTGHHYKDGLAFKFEDETYETTLRNIEWTPTRFGEIAPVGVLTLWKLTDALFPEQPFTI